MAQTTLHVGVTARHLQTLIREARKLGLPFPSIDGDGWECWGEAVGTDVNDKKTLHVMFTASEISADTVLALDKAATLARMTTDRQAGIYANLSDSEDWEVGEVSFGVMHPEPAKLEPWHELSASAKSDWTLVGSVTR